MPLNLCIHLVNQNPVLATFTSESYGLGQDSDVSALSFEAKLAYGSGGTSAKVYIQTSLDNGATWTDIACFAFATANAIKISTVNIYTALAAAITPSDGALTDNTILSGLIGDRIRAKAVVVGNYVGTTLDVWMVGR